MRIQAARGIEGAALGGLEHLQGFSLLDHDLADHFMGPTILILLRFTTLHIHRFLANEPHLL